MCSRTVFRVVGLTKRYAGSAVYANSGIDLEIERGDVFGLFGANGAGKSTLVKQLMNLVRPTAGEIYLDGKLAIGSPDWVASRVAYLPQQRYAFYSLTAAQIVYRTGRLRGLGRQAARSETERLLFEWELGAHADMVLSRLSGGQQRLVGLVMALIGDLPILILDEPTNELDPLLRREVWRKLIGLSRGKGKTIVLVTHNLAESEQVVNRAAILRHGRIAAVGSPSALKHQVDAKVRLELTCRPEVDATRITAALPCCVEVLDSTPGSCRILVPPERLSDVMRCLLRAIPMEQLEDIHVRSASLEEVFAAVGGGTAGQPATPAEERLAANA